MRITRTQELSSGERGMITHFVTRVAKRMADITGKRNKIDEYIGYGYLGICVHLNTEGWDRDGENGIKELFDSAIYYMLKYFPCTSDSAFDGTFDEEEED